MSSYQTIIRDACYTKINSLKSSFVITDFDLSNTYFPSFHLESIEDKPKVVFTAMGMGSDRSRIVRNTGIKQLQLSVLCHILQKIEDQSDNAVLDKILELGEQIMDACEDDELVSGEKYKWSATEPLKDENGLIYDFEALSESGVFQSVFNLNYTYILQ